MKNMEHVLESTMFNTHRLLAPFYIGFVASIVTLIVKFTQELIHIVPRLFIVTESAMILAILTLVFSGVMYALMNRIAESGKKEE